MKKVYEISVLGEFKQYLMISETKHLQDMCKAWGEVTIRLVELSPSTYKHHFGK